MKVAVIFDNRLRSETTGFYCRRALGRMADVEQLYPEELGRIPAGLFDLFVIVDDGLDYQVPDELRPRAAWAIDTHMSLERCIARFGNADWVFAAQKLGAAQMQQALARDVQWLPLACDPDLHHPIPTAIPEYNIGFVGHEIGNRRMELLKILAEHFPHHWFGQAFHRAMAERYSQFNVAFNCSVSGDLNMRVFEALACGAALVTDVSDASGLSEIFELGEHLIGYTDGNDLVNKVSQLLEDDPCRQKMAALGRQHVLAHHTYEQRMRVILDRARQSASRLSLPVQPNKTTAYFEFDRPDVAALVPTNATRILDIGCGGGKLGALLKSRQTCTVWGIELSTHACELARVRLDCVIQSSIETLVNDSFEPNDFDCIIFADVLEHLRTPIEILKKCQHWLTGSGSIVISVPNNRHHSVISGLIDGNWTYEAAGLLDEDHVRCFTLRELEKMLYRAGLNTAELASVPGDGYQSWERSGRSNNLEFGNFSVSKLSQSDAEEFFVYQYLARAQRRPCRDFGLTSIVIITYNQLSYTRQCVESILVRTDEPYELIFVDNGSTDGTPDYLTSISGARVILNSENRGFAPAVNQALRVANGQQILLLNNDTIVTTAWLEGLLDALYDRPDTGLVGPVSNNVSGSQQIPVTYTGLASLDGFAWQQRKSRNMTEVDRLVGFCLLVRREVIDAIGLLDERGCSLGGTVNRRELGPH